MGIPYRFDPLGTLGGGGIERLEFVLVDGTTATANEDLIVSALGASYELTPYSSDGFEADVWASGFSGTYEGAQRDYGPVSVGVQPFENTWRGQLLAYYNNKVFTLRLCGRGFLLLNGVQMQDGFWYRLQYSGGNFTASYLRDGEMYTYSVGTTWDANEKANTVRLVRMAGLSYRFHALKVVTESQSFEAAPARKGGKDGIAFYIDGKFESFLEL